MQWIWDMKRGNESCNHVKPILISWATLVYTYVTETVQTSAVYHPLRLLRLFWSDLPVCVKFTLVEFWCYMCMQGASANTLASAISTASASSSDSFALAQALAAAKSQVRYSWAWHTSAPSPLQVWLAMMFWNVAQIYVLFITTDRAGFAWHQICLAVPADHQKFVLKKQVPHQAGMHVHCLVCNQTYKCLFHTRSTLTSRKARNLMVLLNV